MLLEAAPTFEGPAAALIRLFRSVASPALVLVVWESLPRVVEEEILTDMLARAPIMASGLDTTAEAMVSIAKIKFSDILYSDNK